MRAISAADIWAVGSEYNTSAGQSQTLVEHYNGTNRNIVSSPNVGSGTNALVGVATLSTSDVWAVGYEQNTSTYRFQTLVEHWNGTTWSVVPSLNLGPSDNVLEGVAAISASNVWAVGYSGASTLIEHWNGTGWSVVSSPSPGTFDNVLLGVTAMSATDVWAAGYYANYGRKSRPPKTLFEHWNGTSWSVVASPNPGTSDIIAGVTATSATDVWGVGYYFTNPNPSQTLIEHWNGTSWSVVPSPSPSATGNGLAGVTASSSSDVWAVGSSNGFPTTTLIEHWNGSSWNVVFSPSPGTNSNSLSGVSASAASSVWAVGTSTSGTGGPQRTLIEHCC